MNHYIQPRLLSPLNFSQSITRPVVPVKLKVSPGRSRLEILVKRAFNEQKYRPLEWKVRRFNLKFNLCLNTLH